ncbi:hypothetical protein [Streptomyces sp. NPDC000931]|uniref:hypothetical protein n=1 Tax=Streptomyces sp. NPDC000931 TaxID=3154372 RepID=UPI00332D5506
MSHRAGPRPQVEGSLEAPATRSGGLSSTVDVSWTFPSARAAQYTRPALLTPGFSPELAPDDAALGGKAFRIPFAADHQSGSTGDGKIRKPSAEVSQTTARPGAPPGCPRQQGLDCPGTAPEGPRLRVPAHHRR